MAYSSRCHKIDRRDITVIPHSRQQLSAEKMKADKDTAFGIRLREAFRGATNAEISRNLDVGGSTITDYMRGKTYPTAEGLLRIAEITKVSIHWLLTGEEQKDLNPLQLLTAGQQEVVEALARLKKTPAAEQLQELTHAGLISRVSELFSRYRRLRPSEVDELHILLKIVTPKESDAAADRPSRTG